MKTTEENEFAINNPYRISISDGHNEDVEDFKDKAIAEARFEELKQTEDDLHLLEFNPHLDDEGGYEVIDSYYNEDNDR